jgi:cellulose synthase/poly-beta-1,6-N-acetylglucosamine synthase-like glycosyltransferase
VTALAIIFWVLLAIPVYAMLLYPLLMLAIAKVVRYRFQKEPITPRVSLIVAAYNEEKSIAEKLENSLALDYPRELLEIIVASDSSDDRTDEIVRSFADRGIKLVRTEGNLGKSATLNEAVRQSTGEILCFSDATGMWSREAIRAMVEHYADPRIGCVSGWVAYHYDRSAAAEGFKVYQRFVMALRRAEASMAAHCNAPGSIHSIRRSAFCPLPAATFGDMVDPYHTAVAGLRTAHEDRAISWEESRVRVGDEWQARKRICLRAWTFLFYALRRFPILRSPAYCFQVVSHKFCRWVVGPLMIPLFVLNALLLREHWIYQVLFGGQIAYYGATLVGLALARRQIRVPGLSGLVFYNSVNFCYLVTLLEFLCGKRVARWRPNREISIRGKTADGEASRSAG